MPLFFSLVRYAARVLRRMQTILEKSGKQPHIHIRVRTQVVEIAVSLASVTAIAIITATNKQPLRHIPHSHFILTY